MQNHADPLRNIGFRSNVRQPLVFAAVLAIPVAVFAQPFQDMTSPTFPMPFLNEYSEQIDLGDVDGDFDLDIVIANGRGFAGPSLEEQNRIFINNGAGQFSDQTAARFPAGLLGFTRDVEFGDVDADGDLDLLIVNTFNTQSWLWMNNGAGVFTDETGARLPALNFSGSDADFGDVDNDGDLDIIWTNTGVSGFGSGVDQLYLNDGAGFFSNATATNLPGTAVAESIDADFVDIDGDLDLDLVMAHRNANSQLWENDGNGNFTDITAGNLPADGGGTYSIDPGDIDGDGDLDLLVVRGSTELGWRNNGSGTFTNDTATIFPTNPAQDDNDGDFFDMDNDGDLDYVIARLGSGGERIYRNNGAGVMQLLAGAITVVSDSTLDIEIADLDGDGAVDIITAQGESGSFLNRAYTNLGAADTLAPTYHGMTELDDTSDTAGPYVVRAVIRDGIINDNNFYARETVLNYDIGGGTITVPLRWAGGDHYRGEIPGQPAGTMVDYWVGATDWAGNASESGMMSFSVGGGNGDSDGDGDVDLTDFANFQLCFTGPGGAAGPGCGAFDFDGDGDVDLADFGSFQLAFTGPL